MDAVNFFSALPRVSDDAPTPDKRKGVVIQVLEQNGIANEIVMKPAMFRLDCQPANLDCGGSQCCDKYGPGDYECY